MAAAPAPPVTGSRLAAPCRAGPAAGGGDHYRGRRLRIGSEHPAAGRRGRWPPPRRCGQGRAGCRARPRGGRRRQVRRRWPATPRWGGARPASAWLGRCRCGRRPSAAVGGGGAAAPPRHVGCRAGAHVRFFGFFAALAAPDFWGGWPAPRLLGARRALGAAHAAGHAAAGWACKRRGPARPTAPVVRVRCGSVQALRWWRCRRRPPPGAGAAPPLPGGRHSEMAADGRWRPWGRPPSARAPSAPWRWPRARAARASNSNHGSSSTIDSARP